ncbi:MAG: hydroxymethylglutaryl-CoA lyase [Phycisphaerales bacterium]
MAAHTRMHAAQSGAWLAPQLAVHGAGWVRITEVGPRDGLQNEPTPISTDTKVDFVDALAGAGFPEVEVSSFVSPKWVPQLADAKEVFARIARRKGVTYSALVPNEQGLQRALEARVDKISVFAAASETFSHKNTGGSIAQVLARFAPVIQGAHAAGLPVRGYVSCVATCPYEGPTPPSAVRAVVDELLAMGVDEIDLGDTTGAATPESVARLYAALEPSVPAALTTLHLHDTGGRALDNITRALELGVRSFDSSCGGLGGCPYAPGAKGNVDTLAVLGLLQSLGYTTGVDASAAASAISPIRQALRNSAR